MTKLYYYRTGIRGYEGGWSKIFIHQKEYSADEFRRLIHEAALHILNHFEEYEGDHKGKIVYLNKNGKIQFSVSFDSIEEEVTNILVSEHGFEIMEFQAEWFAWDAVDILTEKYYNCFESPSQKDSSLLKEYLIEHGCKICSIPRMTDEERMIEIAETAEAEGDLEEARKWRAYAEDYRTQEREAADERKIEDDKHHVEG